MALGDFILFKENASGSFDERIVSAAPGKVFSWDENHDPLTIDVVTYNGATKDVDLNAKALTNVASLGVGVVNPTAVVHIVHEQKGAPFFSDKYINDPAGAPILMRKARGSYSSPAAARNNDVAGGFIAQLHDGADFGQAAAIRVRATQNQSPSKHGAKIVFQTVANDTTALTERMVIQHDGKVGINKTSPARTLDIGGDVEATDYYHNNFQGLAQRIDISDSAGTHTLTFSGGLLIDYELV